MNNEYSTRNIECRTKSAAADKRRGDEISLHRGRRHRDSVKRCGIGAPSGWAWDEVHSDDHNQEVVNWMLPPGAHTLEIARREDGALLDAILITDDID